MMTVDKKKLLSILAFSMIATQSNAALIAGVTVKPIRENIVQGWQRNSTGSKALLVGMFGTVCFLAFPVCILSENGDQIGISKSDLIENGMNDNQAEVVISQHQEFEKLLGEKKLALKIYATMTKSDLSTEVKTIMPQASDLYISVLADMLGIQ
ncbi:MAG: hypothetical protein ACOYOK_04395 [Pseudobdellovibrionaceae bacterium]